MHYATHSFSLPLSITGAHVTHVAAQGFTDTVPGSGNFCLLTEQPIARVVAELEGAGVEIVDGPGERAGATGPILSVYFRDPDGNLVEISNRMAIA